MRLKNEVDENVILDSINNMSSSKKELERLRRNVNLKELENRELIKQNIKLDSDNYFLKRRDMTLTALEKSLSQRIRAYEKKNAPQILIMELQLIANMLMMEKEKLLNKEVEEDEFRKD